MIRGDLGAQLRAIAGGEKARLDLLTRKFVGDLYRQTIMATRVDTGRLRGNWQATIAAPAAGEVADVDPNGAATVAEAQVRIAPGAVNYLTNNLPYAQTWEERDAMAGRALANVTETLRRAVDAVNRI